MRYEIDGQRLTDIADAIREKTGKSAAITPEDMPDEIAGIETSGTDTSDATLSAGSQMLAGVTAYANAVKYTGSIETYSGPYSLTPSTVEQTFPVSGKFMSSDLTLASCSGGGGTGKEDEIIAGTISEYSNSSVTEIRNYAFAECAALVSAAFPAVSTIGISAFWGCFSLTTISFPAATMINKNAFSGCSKLESANFPSVTEIHSYAFYRCGKLSAVSFPNVESVGTGAFSGCSSIKTVSFPKLASIGNYAFYNCGSLYAAYFDRAEFIGQFAFQACGTLASVYLRGSSVCTLVNSNAFSSTPIAGWPSYAAGYIYVPASLLSAYQQANNWSFYSSRFRSA